MSPVDFACNAFATADATFAPGVEALLAQSSEPGMHRANLALLGTLPLQYDHIPEWRP